MLTIQNIEDIKNKEFSCMGHEWILWGVDVNNIEYKFIFIPMDYQTKVFELSGYIPLSRYLLISSTLV